MFLFKFGRHLVQTLKEQPHISLLAYKDSFRDTAHTYLKLCDAEQGFLVHVRDFALPVTSFLDLWIGFGFFSPATH